MNYRFQVRDNLGRLWKETLTRSKATRMCAELEAKTEGRLRFNVVLKGAQL